MITAEKLFAKIKYKLKPPPSKEKKIRAYLQNGKIPWSYGYEDFKWQEIKKALSSDHIISNFKQGKLSKDYGISIDERIVEYPWIWSNLLDGQTRLLDAGSTFNFETILNSSKISNKSKTIITYFPENINYNQLNISYIYSDLRDIPIKDKYFNEIICQSTLEHIDMDNSIYGYEIQNNSKTLQKSYEYIKVVSELNRILNNKGQLLLTFPFGKFENHGFFQQFDIEMVDRIIHYLTQFGDLKEYYFRYKINGWEYSTKIDCANAFSYNPHTGVGKGDDNAAHSRAICCLKYIKN